MLTIERHNLRAQKTERLPLAEDIAQDVIDAIFPNTTRAPWWLDNPEGLYDKWRHWITRIANQRVVSTTPQLAMVSDTSSPGTPWDQAAVQLRAMGVPWREVARRTGRSVNTCRSAVRRLTAPAKTVAQVGEALKAAGF